MGKWKLLVADEVLQPDLGGIHLELGRQHIHHAFDAVGGFRTSRAAIRVGGRAVGERAHDIGRDVGRAVQARHHQHAERGDGGSQHRKIRAQILDDLELDPRDGAVAFGGDLVEVHVAAPVDGAQEILAARFDPLHRLLQLHGNPRQQDFLGVGLDLGAEAAADLGSHHAEPVFFQPQNLRHQRAHQVRRLRGGVQVHAAVGRAASPRPRRAFPWNSESAAG